MFDISPNLLLNRLRGKEVQTFEYIRDAEAAVMNCPAPTRSGRKLIKRAYLLMVPVSIEKDLATKAKLGMQARIAASLERTGITHRLSSWECSCHCFLPSTRAH